MKASPLISSIIGTNSITAPMTRHMNSGETRANGSGKSGSITIPIVDHNFTDSDENAGNIYTKGGWVLKMLREQLGEADFFRALHYYLETNRGQNVVTADLEKSIEQATSINADKFFHQWIYRAGAPQFQVSYAYDDAARQVKLNVNQTQKVEGLVGLFDVPIDVEVTTPSGRKDVSN